MYLYTYIYILILGQCCISTTMECSISGKQSETETETETVLHRYRSSIECVCVCEHENEKINGGASERKVHKTSKMCRMLNPDLHMLHVRLLRKRWGLFENYMQKCVRVCVCKCFLVCERANERVSECVCVITDFVGRTHWTSSLWKPDYTEKHHIVICR